MLVHKIMQKTLLALFLAVSSIGHAANIFSFTFDNDLQGWGGSRSGAPATPAWQSSNGNPGGYYSLSDNFFSGGTNSGTAQASTAISLAGATPASVLSLDVRVSDLVNISSYNLTAYLTGYDTHTGAFAWTSSTFASPLSVWQTLSVPITTLSCSPAPGSCGAFSEVTGLWIDLAFSGLNNNNPASISLDLDNVILATNTPEPAIAGLIGAGLIAMAIPCLRKSRSSHIQSVELKRNTP